MSDQPVGVLFVCLGNICRSPAAKGIFQHLVKARGVERRFAIDSCGTGGWHVGNGADPRTIAVMAVNRVPLAHAARRFAGADDLDRFHWILAMDLQNVRDLERMGAPRQRVRLLRSFDPALAGLGEDRQQVADPYYGGEEGFQVMFDHLTAACEGFLEHALAHPPHS